MEKNIQFELDSFDNGKSDQELREYAEGLFKEKVKEMKKGIKETPDKAFLKLKNKLPLARIKRIMKMDKEVKVNS
jgi:hypothetical protein